MILQSKRVELIPFLGDEDLTYAYKIVSAHNPRATEQAFCYEIMQDGFQFYVGYADGVKGGIAFAKHYKDGLSMDGYTDPRLSKGRAVWFSLIACNLMMKHLFNFTDTLYIRIEREDTQLEKLAKTLRFKFDHYEKSRAVFSFSKQDYVNATMSHIFAQVA